MNSYVSLLTSDEYIFGIMLLANNLKQLNSKYPLHILITNDITDPVLEILHQLKVTYELVEKINMPDVIIEHNKKFDARQAAIWKYCLTKFKIFDLTQFNKIVFLDADVMLLKNIDHLFNCPHMTAALDGEYFNLWPDDPHFNAGCMVIEPNHNIYENLINFTQNIKNESCANYLMADQEILNLYYNNWPYQKELHLNKWYNIFTPYLTNELDQEIYENAYFLHFVGRKPWQLNYPKQPNESYSEFSYQNGFAIIQQQFLKLDFDLIMNKVKLSIYAICKNEKENIKDWLKCFSKADYVCVLDTGSTDGTWELLQEYQQQYPNLIINQKIINPWRFDTARNESLKLVPKDTIIWFMVDLDERIKKDDWVNIIKESWHPDFQRGKFTYHRDVKENDVIMKSMPEYRIHNKYWNHYKNIVHEILCNEDNECYFYDIDCTNINIEVWHYPKKNKVTNYIELCEQELLENPDNDVMRLQLAIEYHIANNTDKAKYHYQWLTTHKTKLQPYEIARCYFGLGRIAHDTKENNEKEALAYYTFGRVECPGYFDNYLDAAMIYYNNAFYDETIELCECGLKNCYETSWCGAYDSTAFYTFYLLGMSYYSIGQKVKGLGFLDIALTKNPQDKDIINSRQQIIYDLIDSYKNNQNINKIK